MDNDWGYVGPKRTIEQIEEDALKGKLETIENKLIGEIAIHLMEESAEKFVILTEADARNALSMALQSRKFESQMEKTRTELTRPHLDYQRAINKLAKDFKEKLESIEKSLHKKIDIWIEINKENPFLSVDEIKVEDGMLYTQKKWDFEIIDKDLIPMSYKCIDEIKIKEAVEKGLRDIPGIRIYQNEKTVLRTKNLEK